MTTTPGTPRSPSVTRPARVAGTSRCGTCAKTDAVVQSAKRSAAAAREVARTRFGFDRLVFEGARVGMADSSTARNKSEKGGSREADFGVKRAARLAVQLSPRNARQIRLRRRAYNHSADARKPNGEGKSKKAKGKSEDDEQRRFRQPPTTQGGAAFIRR